MPTHEENKEERRRRVLDTVEGLIRSTGETDFNMRQLAKESGVSFKTLFNLFGTKGEMLVALLEAKVGDRWQTVEAYKGRKKAIARLYDLGEGSASFYIGDKDLFRPLLAAIGGVSGREIAGLQPGIIRLWRLILEQGVKEGSIRTDIDIELFARSLQGVFRGLLWRWAMKELPSDQIRIQLLYQLTIWLLSACVDEQRPDLEKKRKTYERKLSST